MTGRLDFSRRVRFKVKPEVRRGLGRMNISQNEMAGACGFTSGHFSQLLSGVRFAGPITRQRLIDTLGWKFDDLFEEVVE